MHWIVLSPFHGTADPASLQGDSEGWILEHIPANSHTFTIIPASYRHDRSRPATSLRHWCDYVIQAFAGWRAAGQIRDRPVGFITVFPQLAVLMGALMRVTLAHHPVLAWCFNMGKIYDGPKGFLAKFGVKRVNLIVVHSAKEVDTYGQWLGLPRQRLVFVPLSVKQIQPCGPASAVAPFVLAMGTANRDYRLLLRVLAHLQYPAIVVCGPHAVTGIDIPVNVTVKSGLSAHQCQELCQQAQFNVIALLDDATAAGQVTLIEAMMLGKAVIASDVVGVRDYAQHGLTALLVPPGDDAAMQAAVAQLWGNPLLCRQIGIAARRHALAHFTFPQAALRMQGMLDDLENQQG